MIFIVRVFVDELKRTRGSEAELVNIACSALHIRDPRAHVPLSLAATCQLFSIIESRAEYL